MNNGIYESITVSSVEIYDWATAHTNNPFEPTYTVMQGTGRKGPVASGRHTSPHAIGSSAWMGNVSFLPRYKK